MSTVARTPVGSARTGSGTPGTVADSKASKAWKIAKASITALDTVAGDLPAPCGPVVKALAKIVKITEVRLSQDEWSFD